MAAMGTAGTSGTRNPGALRLSPRRNATTEACTNANKPRNARLARIAIVSIVRKTRKPAPTNVRATAAGGTSRPPMRAKLSGRRRSRAMLNEVLIAAVRFEFKAPYIETIPMINTTTLTYGPPTKCRMPERTMSSDPPRQPPHAGHPDSLSLGTFPSTAKKNPPYTRNASKSARNTPRGTLLSGCFTWSDSCATTSKPWKAMKRTPAPSIKSSDETEAPTAKPRGGPGWKTEMTPRTATRTISRILPNVNRPSARTGRWTRAKCAIAERARTARATRLTSSGFGPKNDDSSEGRTSSTRKMPRPRALSADAAMWPPHESQPLTNPLGAGNALLTQTYAPPEASGRPDASSAYAMPARAATSAATARLSKTRGPATEYAAPTRRKIAAPTIAPRAAIVMSNRPRSRVTRTRTEADPGPGPDTEGRRMGRLLEAMAVARYKRTPAATASEEKSGGLRRRGLRRRLRDRFAKRPEDELDILACLRGTEEIRGLKRLGRLFHLFLAECGLVLQVRLVDRERDGGLAYGPEHGLDPRVQVLERVVSSDVGHREDALRPMEVSLPEEFAESLRAHDVPDGHVHLDCVANFRIESEFFLGDFRAERHDVSIIVLVQHVALDERGLAHGVLPDEADFHLHSPWFYHDGPRRDSTKSSGNLRLFVRVYLVVTEKNAVLRPMSRCTQPLK